MVTVIVISDKKMAAIFFREWCWEKGKRSRNDLSVTALPQKKKTFSETTANRLLVAVNSESVQPIRWKAPFPGWTP